MKILEDINITISSIPRIIKPNGHKRIGNTMIFFWVFHIVSVAILTLFTILPPDNDTVLLGSLMIILQLMVTKIFESLNKMYDNCMRIQSNVSDIQMTILNILKEYNDFIITNAKLLDHVTEHLSILNERIIADLEAYSRNMHILTIVGNSFLWKSPEYTPYLEKDVIRDKFATIMVRLKRVAAEHRKLLRAQTMHFPAQHQAQYPAQRQVQSLVDLSEDGSRTSLEYIAL
jgi:hypothetical protein